MSDTLEKPRRWKTTELCRFGSLGLLAPQLPEQITGDSEIMLKMRRHGRRNTGETRDQDASRRRFFPCLE